MKQMKCYDCEEHFEGETPMDVLNKMHPHYVEKHPEILAAADDVEKKRWMARFYKDWAAAHKL